MSAASKVIERSIEGYLSHNKFLFENQQWHIDAVESAIKSIEDNNSRIAELRNSLKVLIDSEQNSKT